MAEPSTSGVGTLSAGLRSAALRAAAVLVIVAAAWVVLQLLAAVALVSVALAIALLLTALLAPVRDVLVRVGLPVAIAALTSMVVLVGIPLGVGLLVLRRVQAELSALGSALELALDDVRSWLEAGPLDLDAAQVAQLQDTLLERLQSLAPAPTAGAVTALRVLGAVALALFAVFFLLKDGAQMWGWLQGWLPRHRRRSVAVAGEAAWATLRGYVVGTVLVALLDAVGIGVVLLAVGVPLWLSLSLLVFVGAFVPVLGATVSGAVAVLVTLVTEGGRDAVIVFVAVLVVQQIEGNVLQPLIMSRAVSLHPLAVVVAVSSGAVLLGVLGAIVAVPVVAVSYRVAVRLRDLRSPGESAGGDVPTDRPRGAEP